MIRIDSEEDGFWLTLQDDGDTGALVWPSSGYTRRNAPIGYRLRVTDPDQLYKAVTETIGEWIREREQARASMPPRSEEPGFEGHGDFGSDDAYERHIAHQAAKGNL